MEKTIFVENLEATLSLGKKLGELLQPGMLITLDGDLGAGKTTFTKGIGQGLQIKRVINSPTFTILKQYRGRLQLSHFDAYRLEGQDNDLGFEEIFDSDDVCVVEWPEFISDILPEKRLEIQINKIDENARKFVLKAIGKEYVQLLEALG
ncbi:MULTISPECIES: tRNA (adenosine(37)-N6)-threonylcarbamoyltransferase complex ATPase subunit type 1 TsaE [unclassified Thomasclavelia]|uniref:tRNA threonylcarbamoyladenosine biosynthesis protein TsaE n=1 Tax=Candidatus Erysipelatoclostridium merdavium TaxID=2838566 RepID=A0A9D2BM17_9FIRM|nr:MULTISPECIES: tRNA (adenosine(37)-N6)-threonylcarbamoyltransferase complex ATPase subunit type 1 TsaE [unclassified Thomasclavelia]OUP78008.1 tRNA (adenosine(37)-N6)-threonylcarbamoyltransferase complex ATPase subunit type 1 TsaE [Erysipelatoclostridium sp. An173]OUQ03851.1 tRNA (adenosine(37)-N6)-threonylcarbamoyltransferase complex ATPase subunit type 1 TsaE [Erysipelatoclostridium sp. An15]HIX80427.1 tRNA (adenosine(37)-N6)-threonylcarbamoyltransferase complex ATPase subunit type 1 TsaE [C